MRYALLAGAWLCCEATSLDAAETAWRSTAEAQAFLADALPKATRQNPSYENKADGSVSEWFTDRVEFGRGSGRSIRVEMFESFTQSRAGAKSQGKHEAAFDLTDVEVAEFEQVGDVTPAGAASRGVIFTCLKPGCIGARWNEDASRADKTDISLQDDAERARVLSAFQYLRAHGA